MQLDGLAIIADSIVNVFGAAGVAIVALDTWRTDPRGAVTRRVVAALGLIGTLFLVRGIAWWTGSGLLDEVAVMLAAAVPLAALVVAEGLLRRHAPRILKQLTTAGFLAIVLFTLIPIVPAAWRYGLLALLQLGSLSAIGLMLWRRDSATLSARENEAIRRIALALVLVVPAVLTDFRFLLPDVPVRMGAFGALLALYLGFGVGGTSTTRERLATQLGFLCIAAVLAIAYVSASATPTLGSGIRAAVVSCCGLVVAALISESLGARTERERAADPLLLSGSPSAFEAMLCGHPLLAGSTILSETDLAHVRHSAFDSLVAERPVLRLRDMPWKRAPTDDGVERARSLLTAHEATHLLRLSRAPLRLLVISMPNVSADQRAENDLGIAQHIAELLYDRESMR